MKTEVLKEQYHKLSGRADRMRGAKYDQFSQLIDDADVTLGVPMEGRVKMDINWKQVGAQKSRTREYFVIA